MKWKIPMTWEMYGVCIVEADTLEQAREIAMDWRTDLPKGTYVDDSIRLDDELVIDEMNSENLIHE